MQKEMGEFRLAGRIRGHAMMHPKPSRQFLDERSEERSRAVYTRQYHLVDCDKMSSGYDNGANSAPKK